MRIRFTFEIDRKSKEQPSPEQDFEHRDADTLVESTGGGDPEQHRMGFVPAPTGD